MELLSNTPRHQTVPDKYIFPLEKRPGRDIILHSINLPVIDLHSNDRSIDTDIRVRDEIIKQIMRAGQEFGFFQVVNHGVSEQIMNDMMQVCEDFFKLPAEEKAAYYSVDQSKPVLLNSSTTYDKNETRYWRDYLKLVCYPVDEVFEQWPEKPKNFREVLGKYIVQVREVSAKLLKLIAEALVLEKEYFCGDLSEGKTQMNVNHYPACPDPSLTLGLLPHCDRHLITLLQQGTAATGLQAKYENGWINVEPIPNAFVVNFGHQLEIVTNGMLKSVEHRAVTNSVVARTSVATLIMPKTECLIAPAKELVNENNPPKYKQFVFKDFLAAYDDASANREDVLDFFKLNK